MLQLKVLTSCVTSTLLYNCETFGPLVPDRLWKLYTKMIKSALNVRPNTPDEIVLIEGGLLPIRALIQKRQLKFFRNYKSSLDEQGTRKSFFAKLLLPENCTSYLRYYLELDAKYSNPTDIYKESLENLRASIRSKACPNNHYRCHIYTMINPNLLPSPFLSCVKGADHITRFRLGSHKLPIETGRWHRIPREERLCTRCQVMRDEYHFICDCHEISRANVQFERGIGAIWRDENIFKLFNTLANTEYL